MFLPELIYYLGYRLKKRLDLNRQRRLPCKTISIGNLTMGGTGKTPAVITLAEEAKRRGYTPVILTRGYKGTMKGPCFVSRGDGPIIGPDEAGDEAFLMARRLKGIPVIKSSDRYKGGTLAIDTFRDQGSLLCILDDGYQHLRLFRDLNILLIDGINPFGNRRLFPLGRLREPLKGIERADIIVITRSSTLSDQLVREIKAYNDRAPLFTAEHRPLFFGTMDGRIIPIKEAFSKRVMAFCGLGNPESFRKSLTDLGIDLRDFIVFKDHHRFSQQDLRRIRRAADMVGAEWIITTEKDIIKFKDIIPDFLYLSIDFKIGENFFEEVFRRI